MARFSSSLWFLEVDRIAWTQVSPWPLAKDSLQSAERSQLQHFHVGKKLKKKVGSRKIRRTQAPRTPQFISSHTTCEDRKTGRLGGSWPEEKVCHWSMSSSKRPCRWRRSWCSTSPGFWGCRRPPPCCAPLSRYWMCWWQNHEISHSQCCSVRKQGWNPPGWQGTKAPLAEQAHGQQKRQERSPAPPEWCVQKQEWTAVLAL